MKRVSFLMVPFVLALTLSSGLFAAEGEWTITLGCAHCNYEKDTGATSCAAAGKTSDGKIVQLKGDAMKGIKFKAGGDYKVKGEISADGKSITVKEIKKA
ncbi:MAG TPA: hypothetical protein VEK08_22115 [Planctomycetota bacterium]|nr:hypothetical protein [Planctomycetota bacterium]